MSDNGPTYVCSCRQSSSVYQESTYSKSTTAEQQLFKDTNERYKLQAYPQVFSPSLLTTNSQMHLPLTTNQNPMSTELKYIYPSVA